MYYTDDRGARIPNPARNLNISVTEDMRVGFFGHMVINMTWENPSSKLSNLVYFFLHVTLFKKRMFGNFIFVLHRR